MQTIARRRNAADRPSAGTIPQPRWITSLVCALGSLVVLAPVVGAFHAHEAARSQVMLIPLRLTGGAAYSQNQVLPIAIDGITPALSTTNRYTGVFADRLRGGYFHPEPDPVLSVLANTGSLIAGLTVGLLAALMIGLVRTMASGEPFARGNAARLTLAALTITAAAAAASVLPYWGAQRFLAQPFVTPEYWAADLQLVWWPLPTVAILLILAAAVHGGSRLRRETEGLV